MLFPRFALDSFCCFQGVLSFTGFALVAHPLSSPSPAVFSRLCRVINISIDKSDTPVFFIFTLFTKAPHPHIPTNPLTTSSVINGIYYFFYHSIWLLRFLLFLFMALELINSMEWKSEVRVYYILQLGFFSCALVS